MELGILMQGDEIGQVFGSDISLIFCVVSDQLVDLMEQIYFLRLFIPFDETSFWLLL